MRMHPEVLDAMREIERRDLAVLRANESALLMRPVYEDLGEEAQLRELYQGQCGTSEPIAAVIVLIPPRDGDPPARVPLSHDEAIKWSAVGSAYEEAAS